jgi:hypothetical protein
MIQRFETENLDHEGDIPSWAQDDNLMRALIVL